MKLTEKIILNDLEDNQFMIVEEIDFEGLKYGQINFKGVTFQIDTDLNTVDNLGYREASIDFKVNAIFEREESQ